MTFKSDLQFGKAYEEKYEDILKLKFGKLLHKSPNYQFKDYDYKFQKASVEIKADRLVQKTGNFFIEYECKGNLSGLQSSKSTHYLLINSSLENDAYLIKTIELKNLCINCRKIRGGDNMASKGFLLSINLLKRFKMI